MATFTRTEISTGSDLSETRGLYNACWRALDAIRKHVQAFVGEFDEEDQDAGIQLAEQITRVLLTDRGPQSRRASVGRGGAFVVPPTQSVEFPKGCHQGLSPLLWLTGNDLKAQHLPIDADDLVLSGEDFDALVAMLQEAREPSPRLLRAAKRYGEQVGW